MKKINFIGIIIGIIFLGVAALFYKWSLTDKDRGISQGILIFGGIGIFFIYQSFKGKSTSAIFHTDVGGVAGVSPGTNIWTYLKWLLIVAVLIFVVVFFWVSFSFKGYDVNSWQNRLSCLVNRNCISRKDFESATSKPYTKESQSYTYDNYWFYFTYPEGWKVDYKKNNDLADPKSKIVWEFRFAPLEGSASHASSLTGVGTMYLYIYKTYFEGANEDYGINGFIKDVFPEHRDNIVVEGKSIGKTYIHYLNPNYNTEFKPQYAVTGTNHTYRMVFSDDTSKEIEDKITKYLFQLIYFK